MKTKNIAVVGIACHFPGAQDYQRFWENLANSVDSIREIPRARWDPEAFYSPSPTEPNKSISKWGGLLDDVERFDHRFFGISPREASSMDPQQRLLLEQAWRAVEDSGIPLRELQRKRTCVLAGAMTADHLQEAAASFTIVDGYATLGAYHGLIANRISHCLGLRGSSLAIDAGHAASLVALHQGVEALRSGDADYALVGGVNVILSPWKYISFSKARMLSPEGRCKTFDRAADGYVPGEGAGVLLLQRLGDAVRDRNCVRGVIRGSAVNHCGTSISITAPVKDAQREVILQAYEAAGFGPESVSYVEAHGTGTPLGDATEIAALREVFGPAGNAGPCLVGSAKTNIGHLEAASGIAGVIKALLMLEHRRIPRTLNVTGVHPDLPLAGSRLAIATEAVEWKPAARRKRLRCGVSGFGFGGVNAHVLLESPPPPRKSVRKRGPFLFLLSAKSETALAALLDEWKSFVAGSRFAEYDLADICGTLMGRGQFPFRYGVVVRGKKMLRSSLLSPRFEPDGRNVPQAALLREWLSGRDLDWESLGATRGTNRVALPVCVFEGEHLRLPKTPPAESRTAAADATSDYLKTVLAEKLACLPGDIAGADAFEGVLGIDSFLNLEVLEVLEKQFGPLPKTLLFEHATVDKLGEYLQRTFPGKLAAMFDAAPPVRPAPAATSRTLPVAESPEIAIIGLAGRFPKAETADALWERLIRGESCIREVPPERWDLAKHFDPAGQDRDRSYTRWGGFLDHFDCFDPLFFRISPRQAEQMDPQQRIFLETAWAALEDAGHTTRSLPQNTGVFAGVSGNTYGLWAAQEALKGNVQSPDTDPSDIANRVSHFLDLRGPSLSVDTACSSSLTALHLAVQSLARGECEAAFAGGVNLTLHPQRVLQFCRKEMLQRGQDCHPFGAGPGGFVDGEGVAVVLLKPLAKALADGDHIYAVIKGTAINSEGRTSGYTVPSPDRQADLIVDALRRAGVDPRTIGYVEAHGTGTQLGDPIEIEGLTRAFRTATGDTGFCAIGSLKSNIGHLIAAAGIAGVTKVLLQMKHRTLVPSLHAATLNPYIDFESTPFRVQREVAEWRPVEGYPRRAGVSSFGSGGANAHVILEEPPQQTVTAGTLTGPVIVPLSAKTPERLAAAAANLLRFLEHPGNSHLAIRDVAYTLQAGREAMPARAVFVVESVSELARQLRAFPADVPPAAGELAARWLSGAEVDWDALWTAPKPRRISLPAYPFLRQRYWMPMSQSRDPETTLCCRPLWKPEPLRRMAPKEATTLILTGTDRLVAYRHDQPGRFHIDPANAADYERLLADCLTAGCPLRVIHLWAPENLRSVFLLAQAIAKLRPRQSVEITCGFAGNQPRHAAVEGLLHAAHLENPKLTYRVVEFESAADILRRALDESASEPRNAAIRYRDGQRWRRVMERIEAGEARQPAWRNGGVYVITGGCGGLGMTFAEHLAAQGPCRLALLGRSAAGPAHEAAIRRLEQAGAEAMYVRADVARQAQVEDAIREVKSRFGAIHGVIHAAGIKRDAPLTEKTWEDAAATLGPKVDGTVWLDAATQDEPLDFFTLFSSIAAWMHAGGLADYACANSFLHHFAEWREEQRRDGKRRGQTLSIEWPEWAEGGMRISGSARSALRQQSGLAPLSNARGLQVWESALAAGQAQCLVMHGIQDRIAAAIASRFPAVDEEPERDTAAWLRAMAAEEIGLQPDEIDPQSDLASYGFDSLNMRQLIARLEERLGPLSKSLLLEYTSVRALAGFVAGRCPSPLPAAAAETPRWVAPQSTDIAIVGMSGRYPDARNLDEFWANLRAGRECIREVPASRWDAAASFDPDPAKAREGKIYSRWGAFLDGVDRFDPLLFEITPLEAKGMHPEERLLLETAWSALEDAGYTRESLRGRPLGVFVGVNALTYPLLGMEQWRESGNAPLDASYYTLPNRVSYFFDFTGPSVPVDTGCSSSLVAIHMACESIRSGACEAALAGGVNLYLHRSRYWMLCRDRLLSTAADARLFKRGGDGFVPGEGAGAVLLKPLDRALADGDTIYGVVRASAVTHKGRSNGFLAPSPRSQTALMRQALQKGGVDPADVSYLEIQATGAEMADAAEWKALLDVYGAGAPCAIGSVKPSIGHLEAASGIAQVTKVLLQMRHGQLAPALAADHRNEEVETAGTRFYLPHSATSWTGTRHAAVTSIAAGGTAAHVILEDYPRPPAQDERRPELIVLSARSRAQLDEYVTALRDHLRDAGPPARLADVAFTLQHGRTAFEHRFAAIAADRGELVERLTQFLETHRVETGAGSGPLEAAAGEWLRGGAVDWTRLRDGRLDLRRVPLPTYPFERRRCWIGEGPAAPATAPQETGVVADYYNRMTEALQKQALALEDETYVLFAPFAEKVPGFSWINAFFDPAAGRQHRDWMQARQKELKAALYRDVDFGRVQRVFDIGCGLATDLIQLARRYPGLRGEGFTITPKQAEAGAERIRRAGLDDRLRVHCADSTSRPFPGLYDLVIGFEVIFHIENKQAVFDNIAAHLDDNGVLVLADGVTNTVAAINLPHQGQFTATAPEFSRLLAESGLRIDSCADASAEISNFLYDPRFEENLAAINNRFPELRPVEHEHRCWDNFGKVLGKGLVRYLLFTIRKARGESKEALVRINEEQIRNATPYAALRIPREMAQPADLEPEVRRLAAEVLEIEPGRIDVAARFRDYGVGSLQGLLLLEAVNRNFGLTRQMHVLYDHSSIRDLCRHIRQLQPRAAEPATDIEPEVRRLAAEVLEIEPGRIDVAARFSDYGVGSLQGLLLLEAVNRHFGLTLPMHVVYDHSSIRDLCRHIQNTQPVPQPQPAPAVAGSDVAVIGMAGRFAGAGDISTFWANLKNGVDSIQEVPPDRWDLTAHYDPDPARPERSYSKWGGFIAGADLFDAEFFRISPREAELMDPQQRLFLEACWTALEDAGCAPESLDGARCGVYAGVMGSDYLTLLGESGEPPEAHTLLGNDDAILASRISYFLNIKGPAVTIKTACSSSLVAVHMACRSLRDGEADLMLAGGVTLYLHPRPYEMMSKAGMLSPTGKCRPFDDDADGIAVGDGVGVVVLKRLDRALADGDRIYGVIKASGVNQDGKTNGITAPSMESQKALALEVLRTGGIHPDSIGYVEAHGTGTRLGDPIEITALSQAFAAYTARRQFCAIGSVKGNIGHTTAAAGVAGLMKALLALEHGEIPPSLHLNRANRHIDFAASPFFPNTELRPWQRAAGAPRRAAVSAFAFNGTNCHVIVEAAPPSQTGAECPAAGPHVIPLSAKNDGRLRAYAQRLLDFLRSEAARSVSLAEIAYGLQTGRSPMERRLALAARDKSDLEQQLAQYVLSGATAADLPPAAARWLAGEAVDWRALYRDARLRRVSLPTYPFARTRYWIPAASKPAAAQAVIFLRPVWREAAIADSGAPPSAQELVYECRRGKDDLVSIVRLTREILERRSTEPVRLLLIYREGEATPCLHSAALGAFARALNQESSTLHCRTVAVEAWDDVPSIVRAEMRAADGVEVRHAGGKRWILDAGEVDLRRDSNPLRQHGAYIITGAAGGVGALVAEHLARAYRARLVLCGRSPSNPRVEDLLGRLRECGSEAIYVQADVTRRVDADALVAEARKRYGRIHGVFHLAGVIRDSLLAKKTAEDVAAVLAPKVDGAAHLDEATRDEALDLFVLFSSIASLAGNAGQTDYAYANRFLAEFAAQREKLRAAGLRQGRSIAIEWPYWADGGMQLSPQNRQVLARDLGMEPLTSQAGLAALETILASDAGPRIAVFSGNREKLLSVLRRPLAVHTAPAGDRPSARAATETLLKQVIGEHLKTPPERIDATVSFEEYGVDSIMINSFNFQMEALIGAFPRTVMFEHRTIAELADYFAAHHAPQFAAIEPPAAPAENGASVVAAQPPESPAIVPRPTGSGIAIVGMSGRYPRAANLREFWSNLEAGRDCISPIPSDRWDTAAFRDEIYCPYGGFLDGADRFDPLFFGISPRDAEKMDPQERIFLETAWATFEDAGYNRSRLAALRGAGCEVGVFAGVTTNSYLLWGPDAWRRGLSAIPESMPWSIANRVSYTFDLHGPSIPVDTACSSSLSAIHLACDSLRKGECGMALAGGVNLYLHPSKYVLLCQLNMLSRTGRCHSFGAGGDGFVPGEGVGAVLLKPLDRALADGDPIYAVIRGSAINHGGRTNGYTVPNPQSQADLIVAALTAGGIDARTISYVEAHGTGTALGDPVEIAGLTKAFARDTGDKRFCAVGSVKANIGHLESAAGIAGLSKVVLQMRHGRLAPSLHADRLNENIPFAETPFYLVHNARDWQTADESPRRASISSFGAGGSNAHLIVEEYRETRTAPPDEGKPHIFVLSARNDDRLRASAANLLEYLSGECASLASIAYTLQTGREMMAERLAIVAHSRGQLQRGLEAFVEGEAPPREVDSQDHDSLASDWVNGAAVDWDRLWPEPKPARVSLPAYPFAGKKYWIFDRSAQPSPVALAGAAPLHPVLDRNTSTLTQPQFTKELTGREFYLADHVVAGVKTLPGVVYLEMARAAGQIAAGRAVSRLSGVVWLRGIVVDENAATVHIGLNPVRDAVEFEIYTAESGERLRHAQGKLFFDSSAGPLPALQKDLTAIRARCLKVLTGDECYRMASAHGFGYGPSFQAVQTVHCGGREALGHLALPPDARENAGAYVLHPSLLDGALQTLLGLRGVTGSSPCVPFSLKALEIRGAVPDPCYAYVAPAENHSGNGTAEPAYDIWVLNESGEAAAIFQALTLRAIPQQPRELSRDGDPLWSVLQQLEAGEVSIEEAKRCLAAARFEYST